VRVLRSEDYIAQCYNVSVLGSGAVRGKMELGVTYISAHSFVPSTIQVLHG
jgi:hypothetical protein